MIDHNGDVFMFRILELPFGGLEELARLARHDLHVLGAESQRTAAAIHRGVADADDQNFLADALDVSEGHRLQPGDADMDAIRVVAARQVELLALGCSRSHENGIEFFRVEQLPHTLDRGVEAQVRAHVHDVADLLVQHLGGETERRNIRAHQAAGYPELFEYRDLVAQRQQIVRDRERGRARAYAGDALTVLFTGRFGKPRRDVLAVVGCDALQPANGNGFFLNSA